MAIERPILFSGPMVRALIDGRKTQTRRALKPEPVMIDEKFAHLFRWRGGDKLWVREAWAPIGELSECTGPEDILYRATATEAAEALTTWRPSIHMPRWASRITLRVTGVKVERLQDISEEDAKAEGAHFEIGGCDHPRFTCKEAGCIGPEWDKFRGGFADIWFSVNGADSWHANPWVAAISFERVK